MVWFKNLILGSLCVGITAIFGVIPARADIVPYDRQIILRKASTTEEVGIAFLKTTNNFPDFNKVVEGTDAYQKLDPLAQADYRAREVGKLQSAYLAYSPKKSSLMVRLGVRANFHQAADGTATLDFAPPQNGPLYFPYLFAGYAIALIPNGIDLFQHLDLNVDEAQIVYGRLGLDGAATLLLQLFPVAADDQTPVMMDNIPQYPLLAEIGYIGLINERGEQIWAWKSKKFDRKDLGIKGNSDARSIIDLVPQNKP